MATDKQSAIVIRFAVQDGQKVTEALKRLEQEGTASLKKLGEGGQAQARGLVLLQGAADELRGRMQGLAGNAGVVGAAFSSGGVKALAFAAALGVVVAGLRAFISSAPQLVANADAAGLSLERFQSLRAAIIDSGGNSEQASQGLRQFAVQARAANLSTGDLYEQIRKVNPEYARQLALAKDLGEAQRIVVRAMDEAALSSQRAAIGNAAFGESWRFIAAGIRRDQQGLVDAGRIISPELVQRAADVSAKINSIVDTISVRFIGAMKPAVDLLARFLDDLNKAETSGVGRNGQGSERSELVGTRLRVGAARLSGARLAPEDQNFADMEAVVRKRTDLQKQLDDLNRDYVRINDDFERAAERKGRTAAAGENTDQAQAVLDAARARRVENLEARKRLQEEIRALDAQEEDIRQRDMARRGAVPEVTIRPRVVAPVPAVDPRAAEAASRQAEIQALTNEQSELQKKTAAMGEAASATDRQRLADIALRLAQLDRIQLTQRDVELTRSMNLVRLDAERIAARTALGIATEEERLALKQREIANQRRLGIIRTDEEAARALALYRKELRETVNQEQVRQSFTPGLTKIRQDAQRDLRLDIDEGATQSVNEFNAALFQVARGYKDAKTAALDFGVSVIAMFAQILIKRQILGPLAGALSDGIDSFAKGMFVSSAYGNVVTADGPMQLSRYALGGVHRSSGGIARRPTLSLFGEGRTPEAYVPLPDGRTIPVTLDQKQTVNPVAPLSALGAPPVSMTTNVSVEPPAGHEAKTERRQNPSGGEDVRIVFRDMTRTTLAEDFRDGGPVSDTLRRTNKSFR
jgi:hypothetical protein